MYNQPIAFGDKLQDAVKSFWNKNQQLMDPKDEIAAEVADDVNIATDAADEAEQDRGQEAVFSEASTSSEAINVEAIVQDALEGMNEDDGEDVI
jgi:hypothetical protein